MASTASLPRPIIVGGCSSGCSRRSGSRCSRPADILAYGAIVYELGYDRRRTLDRLIAAQSISRDARPITRNRRGFERIDGLRLEVWPAP